ncbi:MAG: response regulator [Acidobacteriota bacterium]|jgi:two-component system cell cycle response regulator|nr:response regulator [Acidobacteriota bacterium]
MSKKVLTVDDSKTVRIIVKKHLSAFGVEILEAENGEIGVAQAKEGMPDLILLDYNMPVMDGHQTLLALKEDPSTNPIPVIMLTTETVQETVLKLVKVGLKDFIAKPFTREILLKKVNSILSIYEGDEPPTVENMPTIAAALPHPPGGEGKTVILAVDDKVNILKNLAEFLGDTYFVIQCETGAAAEEAMGKYHFDYFFLDVTMPDKNWADIYGSYQSIKKDTSSPKKTVIMTLRTAEADIAKAANFGIQVTLYKPFTAMDVAGAIENLQMLASGKKLPWLERSGNVRILHCPGNKNPKYNSFITALKTEIVQEVEGMAEEGLTELVVDLGEGFISGVNIAQKFIDFINFTAKLKLNIRLVVESAQARESAKSISEIAHLPTDTSLEFALKAFAEK